MRATTELIEKAMVLREVALEFHFGRNADIVGAITQMILGKPDYHYFYGMGETDVADFRNTFPQGHEIWNFIRLEEDGLRRK